MHKNSLEVWRGEVQPTLRRRQLQVLKVYQRVGQGTATDIMAITGRPRNVIHPRIGELHKLGHLAESGNKMIGHRNHAILRVTEKGNAVDTSAIEDITPATRYYSREDYKRFCKEFQDFVEVRATDEQNADIYHLLGRFLVTKRV